MSLKRYDIPHAMNSSHGIRRIIWLPYYEDPAYVPLLRRAYALRCEIMAASGEDFLVITVSIDATAKRTCRGRRAHQRKQIARSGRPRSAVGPGTPSPSERPFDEACCGDRASVIARCRDTSTPSGVS
jgi:hypothetical protein